MHFASATTSPALRGVLTAAGIGLVVLLAVVGAATVVDRFGGRALLDPDAVPRSVTPRGDLSDQERTTIEIFQAAAPSVVHIDTSSRRLDELGKLVLGDLWPEGSGSGFLWDVEGHVVTNNHVIRGARTCVVTLADRSQWSATLIGTAPSFDLAVLRIDAPRAQLRQIAVGESSDLLVGQQVFAIGNPFGLDQTLTTGVISGVDRTVRTELGEVVGGLIQSDAAINPGNSGGPLLDSAGRLIGVNTAILSPSGASAGVGFSIPVDTVNRIVPQIIQTGAVGRTAIGVFIANRGLLLDLGLDHGVPIGEVVPGSPAEVAGLRGLHMSDSGSVVADVVLEVAGMPVRNRDDLVVELSEHEPGSAVPLLVWREGREVELTVRPVTVESFER
ncbi:S1C family serine protease [Engelhardtia mirabilis]|uniref:Periplasmic pH-dependent serine endoprotease DegQ n=1 Tax=Engelhardtia mirabilis TaxID=2528011 RepID=A0A518BN04_9BACT|nr:Periplasmic pH-dependent serine endoprotease DegQ precursor [Planctomycetes bacterium Pla133]QDV02690.1 Periplasmic pH-dependent serine endoprotease DegQ precursor [Planctomycetes bacterium Pla86]